MITKNFHVNYETMQKVDSVFYFMMDSNMNKLVQQIYFPFFIWFFLESLYTVRTYYFCLEDWKLSILFHLYWLQNTRRNNDVFFIAIFLILFIYHLIYLLVYYLISLSPCKFVPILINLRISTLKLFTDLHIEVIYIVAFIWLFILLFKDLWIKAFLDLFIFLLIFSDLFTLYHFNLFLIFSSSFFLRMNSIIPV